MYLAIFIVLIITGVGVTLYFVLRGKETVPGTITGPSGNGICKDRADCNGPKGGYCNDGTCICYDKYAGTKCQYSDDTDCNGHGKVTGSGTCECNTGYAGTKCQYSDEVDCNGHGKVTGSGTCTCNPKYAGTKCQYSDEVDCRGKGTVTDSGLCNCNDKFYGPKCMSCSEWFPRCDVCSGDYQNLKCTKTIDDTVFDVKKCVMKKDSGEYGCPIIENPFAWMNYTGGSVHVTTNEGRKYDSCCSNGATLYRDNSTNFDSLQTNFCQSDFTNLKGTTMDGKPFDFTGKGDGIANRTVSSPSLCNPDAFDDKNPGTCYLTLKGSSGPDGPEYHPISSSSVGPGWPKCKQENAQIMSLRTFNKFDTVVKPQQISC